MNVDPILAIGTGATVVSIVAAAFIAIGKLFSRVGALETAMKERAEERNAEREATERRDRDWRVALSTLQGEIRLLGDAVNQAHVKALETFAPLDGMRTLAQKIDNISDNLARVVATQAEVRATIKSTAEGVVEIKRAMERRSP